MSKTWPGAKWMGYNAAERYDPSSMMKVALWLAYVSMAEETLRMVHRESTKHKDTDQAQAGRWIFGTRPGAIAVAVRIVT